MQYMPYFLVLKPDYFAGSIASYEYIYNTIVNVLNPIVIDDSEVFNSGGIYVVIKMSDIPLIHNDLQFLFSNYFIYLKSEDDILEYFKNGTVQPNLI
jgi:hypothetical protein